MRLRFLLLAMTVVLCSACEFKWIQGEPKSEDLRVSVLRYDRLESRYLTTGDFSALQQMNTQYPVETRTLLEDILKLGEVRDPSINARFLNFFQDTVLQTVIADAELQYANMDDINETLSNAFVKLQEMIPGLSLPTVYAQIGAFNQSIVVGDKMIGISLDKYLGMDYPAYEHYYNVHQRRTMLRSYIVPDCLTFYLLSLFPMKNFEASTQAERDYHMGRVQWVVNKSLGRTFFHSSAVAAADSLVKKKNLSAVQLLTVNK